MKLISQTMQDVLGGHLILYQCGCENCAKGHSFGPAVRDHYLIHCIFQGKGRFLTPNDAYDLRAGQAFLILPGQVTTYTADSLHPWQYGWMGFHGTQALKTAEACGLSQEHPTATFSDTEAMRRCIESMAVRFEARANPFALLADMYSFFSLFMSPQPPVSGSLMLDEILDFIRKNYSYHLSVDGLAARCGIDRSQLFRIFKQYLGISPQEYIICYRLERAAQLLKTTSLSVTQVQLSCGFGDLCHFSRLFKNRYGLSPTAFRQGRTDTR